MEKYLSATPQATVLLAMFAAAFFIAAAVCLYRSIWGLIWQKEGAGKYGSLWLLPYGLILLPGINSPGTFNLHLTYSKRRNKRIPDRQKGGKGVYFFLSHKQKISGALAETLRAAGEKDELTLDLIAAILSPAVKKPVKISKVSVPMKPLRQFWPAETPAKEIEKQIIEIVTEYFKQVGGQAGS